MPEKQEPKLEILEAVRRLSERLPPPRSEELSRLAASLREPIHTMPYIPSPEATVVDEVGAQIERLSQITAALLDLGREQGAAQERSRRTAERAANVLVILTVALVVLTYVLVADALGWWLYI